MNPELSPELSLEAWLVFTFYTLALLGMWWLKAKVAIDRSKPTDPDPWTSKDKLWHFSASASLQVVTSTLVGLDPWVAVPLNLYAGVGFEVVQGFPREGQGYMSFKDIVWDVAGIAAGAWLVSLGRDIFGGGV